MQKTKPLDGKIYLKNMTTGEYIEWDGVTEITCEDFEGEFEQQEYYQEILNKFYEAACIRYHMGAFNDKSYEWNDYTRAIHKYPNVLWTHHADMIATHIMEVENDQ